MDQFSLDDVRSFFLEDMQSYISKIADSCASIAKSERLRQPTSVEQGAGAAAFDRVGELALELGSHDQVVGCAPLESLTAALLEFGSIGTRNLGGITQQRARLLELSGLFSDCAETLRRMLAAYADGNTAELDRLQAELEARFLPYQDLQDEGEATDARFAFDDSAYVGLKLPHVDEAPLDAQPLPSLRGIPFAGTLEGMNQEANALVSALAAFRPDPLRPEGEVMSYFAVRDCAHAIHGSCSLVGLAQMAACSRKLEYLANGAGLLIERMLCSLSSSLAAALCTRDCLHKLVAARKALQGKDESRAEALAFEASRHVETLANVLPPSVVFLRAQEQELRLHGQQSEARAEEAIDFAFDESELPELPSAAGELEDESLSFGFESVAEEGSVPVPAGGLESELDEELLDIFRQEARQAVVPLQGYFSTLKQDARRLDVVSSLEKIFHTLKGSSATVGLNEISQLSAELEERMESALELVMKGEQEIDVDFVEQLVGATNRLLALTGLPQITLASGKGRRRSLELSELQQVFLSESETICLDIDAYLRELRSGATAAEEVIPAVGRLFHKLKGSAVVNDSAGIAELAAKMQEYCESKPAVEAFLERSGQALADTQAMLENLRIEIEALDSQTSGAESAAMPSAGSRESTLHEASWTFETVREVVELESPEIWEAFEIESQETLYEMDRAVLGLETSDQPREVVQRLFRSYHTLKGAVNTVGLGPIGRILHRVEDFLEGLIGGAVLPPLANVTRFLLKVQEGVRENLRQARQGFVEVCPQRIEAEIEAVRAGKSLASSSLATETRSAVSAIGNSSAASSAQSSEQDSARTAAKSGEPKAPSSTGSGNKGRERRYIRVPADRLESLMNLTGEIVVDRARLVRRVLHLRNLQRELASSRSRLLTTVETFNTKYEFSNLQSERQRQSVRGFAMQAVGAGVEESGGTLVPYGGGGGRGKAGGRRGGGGSDSVFSDLEMDRYEDVNILARALSEITNDISEVQLQIGSVLDLLGEDSDHFSSNVSDLQMEIMRARMVPLDQLFIRLHRPIRDAADRESKLVRVVTIGEDVTLDKTIVDELYAPMLHLVRNCVSHGIEASDMRRRSGKSVEGVVTMRARQESGQIVLEVTDDGAGLDLASIHRRGVEMGLIAPEVPLESPAVKELIFASGLSVRKEASAVSGRGVGCDVVRREIERLNGQISVETRKGGGTTFRITLPLTLAIYQALIVEQGGQKFALPLNFSEMILDLEETQIHESTGVRRLRYRDSYLALEDLASSLKLEGGSEVERSRARAAVILKMGEHRMAMRVDRIHSQEEIVVKGLGELLNDHPMFSGVTITGDGELILIVDVPGLLKGNRSEVSFVGNTEAYKEGELTSRGSTNESKDERRAVRVLYIDDSLSVRKAAEKLLKNIGAEVALAVDGVDGLDKIRQGDFDMIFTDIEMPRLNGYDMIRELRYIPKFKDIPVAVVTSRSGEKHRQQAAVVGATDYVTKPFNEDILRQQLAKWTHYGKGARGK